MRTDAVIFDIEGTLVDSVQAQVQSWQETLLSHGMTFGCATLQKFSGMDGGEMLAFIIPELSKPRRTELVKEQGKRFEANYLSKIEAFPGATSILSTLKDQGFRLAFATDCNGAPLEHYRRLLNSDDLIDVVSCGEDVSKGKPAPGLVTRACAKLELAAEACIMVGDTPYDALAAQRANVPSLGVLTGGFMADDLIKAGCIRVLKDITQLSEFLNAERH